ncbi:MAG: AAA-like domain-containing protein, partial [Prevotellaceae bacterium]|nr:AAA-like domain-containing protein [Prevotellaceae bacterium]
MRTKEFNITGVCVPSKHYMADVSGKIAQIIALIDKGKYFTINRGRQYGKTTTISLLEDKLPKLGYMVIRISFEGIGDAAFESEASFCQSIIGQIHKYLSLYKRREAEDWVNDTVTTNDALDTFLNKACENKKYVLLIDETDKSSNNLVFLRFLGMLRDKYLLREKVGATFHNVVLAGVYDIKNLKLKMIHAGTHQLQ